MFVLYLYVSTGLWNCKKSIHAECISNRFYRASDLLLGYSMVGLVDLRAVNPKISMFGNYSI